MLVRIVASLTKLQGMSPLEELLHIVAAMRYFVLFSVQSSLTQLFIYLQIFEKCSDLGTRISNDKSGCAW